MAETNHKKCLSQLTPVRDTLDVIGGKWKLLIIIAIGAGNNRFREIERSIPKISSKVLADELKNLEQNDLIKRTVYDSSPVSVEYTLTLYADTLNDVLESLRDWGMNHRKRIFGKGKEKNEK